jgi:hypothetical protein
MGLQSLTLSKMDGFMGTSECSLKGVASNFMNVSFASQKNKKKTSPLHFESFPGTRQSCF